MENNKQYRRSERNKRERFSIRKFNIGVASVAVAAFWMAGGQAAAETTDAVTTAEATVEVVDASTEEASPEAEAEPAQEVATEVSEETQAEEVAPQEEAVEPVVEETAAEESAPEVTATPAEDATPAVQTVEVPVVEETAPAEATAEPVAEEVVTRVVATTYRVQYIDETTGEQVKQQNYSAVEETTNPVDQPHTFNVNIALDTPAGYEAVSATNNAGAEFEVVNNAIAAAIVEKDSASRTIKVAVRKDDTAASNNNQEGYTAFFATAENVSVDNGRITATSSITVDSVEQGYITTTVDIDLRLADGVFQAGEQIVLTFENTGGVGYQVGDLIDVNGNTIAKVVDVQTTTDYREAQRAAGTTLEEKLAANIPYEAQTTTVILETTDRILTNNSTYIKARATQRTSYAQGAEDLPIVARVLVNGEEVVSESVTLPGVDNTKQNLKTTAHIRGRVYVTEIRDYDTNELLIEEKHASSYNKSTKSFVPASETDTFFVQAGEDYIPEGSTFTLKLADTTFSHFEQIGDFAVRTPLLSATDLNVLNDNGVWLWPDTDNPSAKIQVVSVTEDTLVIKLVEGQINPGQNIRFDGEDLNRMGVNRVWNEANWDLENNNYIVQQLESFTIADADGNVIVQSDATRIGENRWYVQRTVVADVNGDIPNVPSRVVVRYLEQDATDENGNPIENLLQDSTVTKYDGISNTYDKTPGAAYDVTDVVAPETITVTDPETGATKLYFLVANTGNQVGTLTDSTTYVDYYYVEAVEETEDVTYRIKVNYIYEENDPLVGGQTAAPTTTSESVTFTRTVLKNPVTGDVISTGDWTSTTTLAEDGSYSFADVVSPTVNGFQPDATNTTGGKAYAYSTTDFGQEVETNTFEQEFTVRYFRNPQRAIWNYVLEGTNEFLVAEDTVRADGRQGLEIPADTYQAALDALLAQGYELVSDEFATSDKTYTNGFAEKGVAGFDRFTIVLREGIITVDPNDPNSPAVPEGVTLESLTETVTRHIKYVYDSEDGQEVGEQAPTVTETLSYTRTATINLVTKAVVYSDWTSQDDTLDTVNSPILEGYNVDRDVVDAQTITDPTTVAQDADGNRVINEVVIYTAANEEVVEEATATRTIVYVYETADGAEAAPTVVQEVPVTFTRTNLVNKVTGEVVTEGAWSEAQTLDAVTSPVIVGYTADTEVVPTVAVNANDALNVVVIYTKDAQKATTTITYLDATGTEKADLTTVLTEEGKSNEPLTKADEIAGIITTAEKAGYALISNDYPVNGNFDEDKTVDQAFTVVLQERVEDVPNDVVPGQPVDPNDPNSPVWPDTVKDLQLTDEVVRTITYVYEDGTPVLGEDGQPVTRTETVTFTRTAKVNLVTGELEVSAWSAPAELPVVASPAITNHTITSVTVDGVEVGGQDAPAATVAAEQADINVVVVYTKDSGKATTVIEYLDATGNVKTIENNNPIVEEGKVETPLAKAQEIADIIASAEKAGYALISNNYPTEGALTQEEQTFKVVVQERIEEVPNDAVPGQPVDPTDPNSPVWPDTIADLVRENVVTRTITYVYEDGTTASATVTETVTFTRTATVNLVTGEVVYGEWSAPAELAAVTSPVITGYLADKASVPAATVVAEQADINEKVVYTPLGSWIPQLPEGVTPVDPTVYPNDPTDPTVPGTDKPTVPYVPGYTPVDPDGNPLQPVDPTDPTKGYLVPDIPADPSQDTPIPYVKNGQQVAKVNYVDDSGKALRISDLVVGPAGKEIDNPTAPRVEELLKAGYELVVNPFDSETFIFDNESDEGLDVPTQVIDVIFKERIVDVPADVVPGQPVDPTDPNSPVWPETLNDLVREDVVTRVIHYVYDDGTPVLDENGEPVVYIEEVTFTRTAQVNLVTGEIIYGAWPEAVKLDTVESPIVEGYLADRGIVDGVLVNAGDEDLEEFVVYTPLGSWVPNLPEGETPVDPIVYPNDPTDPTVPYVPGYTPVDPNGNPLQPVDPADPTKGYIVPDLPADPSQDTPINYVKDPQKATITFITETGVELVVIPEEGESFDPISPVAYNNKLVELHKAGYEVVTDEFGGNQNFDGDKDVDQAFKVIVKERVIPVTPEAVPGQPVDPTDPNSPVWPDTVKDLVTTKEVTRTITYVNEKGETVFETVTQTATFTREATVNLVTGEIVYGEWTPAQELSEVVSPELARHTPNTAAVEVVTVDAETGDIVVEVVYVFNPITEFVDEEGNPVAPTEDGVVDPKLIDGYEFVTTITDENGDVKHVYKKVVTPVAEKPTKLVEKPAPAPKTPKAPQAKPAKAEAPQYVTEETKALPNTGEESNATAVAGMGMLLSALGLAGLRRRKED